MDIIRLTEPNTPLNDADHVGSFNFMEKCQMGDMKQHQLPLTSEEQIENLKSIGLVIKDEEYAQRILKDIKRLNSGQWDFLKIGENYWKLKIEPA